MPRKNNHPKRRTRYRNEDEDVSTDAGYRRTRRVQELRRSNATTPVPSGKTYKRPKAGGKGRDW